MKSRIARFWMILGVLFCAQLPAREIQRGMSYTAWWHDSYSDPGSDQSIQNIASLGSDWVALLVTVYQDTKTSTDIYRDPEKTPTDESVRHAIHKIHAAGMKVMLKVHVDCANGDWRGTIDFGNDESAWTTWFQNYAAVIEDYAQLAESADVEQFCVGTEFRQTEYRGSDWRAIISAVKRLYSGPLTYAANHDSYDLSWWDALDYIGVNAYFNLTSKQDPTMAELDAAWEQILPDIADLAYRFDRPVLFSEIGYRSVDGANIHPWLWGTEGTVDLQEQADCYRAALRAVWDQPWFAGIYWWNWDWNPDYGGTENIDYTPFGKPAEDVLRSWYMNGREVFHVDADAPANGNGFFWDSAMKHLPDALQTATAGADIWVAAGTYYPSADNDRGISFRLTEGVGVYGGFMGNEVIRSQANRETNPTILSGNIGDPELFSDNSYRVVTSAPHSILDGFTIRHGNANGPTPGYYGSFPAAEIKLLADASDSSLQSANTTGGGMHITHSSQQVSNCRFEQNSAERGGAIFIDNASPILSNCIIADNLATHDGAGIYIAQGGPILQGVELRSNVVGGNGGGLFCQGSNTVLTDCRFSGNQAIQGGGLYASDAANIQAMRCRWADNLAETDGGAVVIEAAASEFINCIFFGNGSLRNGGAVFSRQAQDRFIHCTFAHNHAVQTGGGIFSHESTLTMVNSIVWANSAGTGSQLFESSPTSIQVTYTCIEGGYTGDGNLDIAPHFVDDRTGDLRLFASSPCIDQGRTGADLPDYDHELAPRDLLPDMGAYELLTWRTDTQVSRDGQAIAHGTSTAAYGDPNHLGSIRVGTSGIYKFTIANLGADTLVLSSVNAVRLTGVDASAFYVRQLPNTHIAPGTATEFEILFSPPYTGSFTAWVEIHHSDPDMPPFRFIIAGNGKTSYSGITITLHAGSGCRMTPGNEHQSLWMYGLLLMALTVPWWTTRVRRRRRMRRA